MKQFIILTLILCSVNVYAQDVIVMKDGSSIISKVLEVNQNDIKYKKYSNQNGPTYTIDKDGVMSINYENGERDLFNETSNRVESKPLVQESKSPIQIDKQPAANNIEVIEDHNRILESNEKKKDRDAKGAFIVLGVRSSSVMSTEDLEISFERRLLKDPNNGFYDPYYYIKISNKTDKILYVDKGNCFRVETLLNKTNCYYDNSEQKTVTTGSSGSVALGLGGVASVLGIGGAIGMVASGVSLGSGSIQSLSTTYNQQRILAIPPHSTKYLSEQKWVQTKKGNILTDAEYEVIERAENFDLIRIPYIDRGFVKYGEKKILGEDDNQFNMDYYITYSLFPNFDEYYTIKFSLYVHEVIGTSGALLFHDEKVDKYLKSPYSTDIIMHKGLYK